MTLISQQMKKTCLAFQNNGVCPHGLNCRFDHSAGPQRLPGPPGLSGLQRPSGSLGPQRPGGFKTQICKNMQNTGTGFSFYDGGTFELWEREGFLNIANKASCGTY